MATTTNYFCKRTTARGRQGGPLAARRTAGLGCEAAYSVQRMDPEDLREIISAYQKCVAEAVRRFDASHHSANASRSTDTGLLWSYAWSWCSALGYAPDEFALTARLPGIVGPDADGQWV
jgi:hypothetical protein